MTDTNSNNPAQTQPLISSPLEALQIVLRNVGQVVFQCNAISGAVILFGIFYHSINYGLAATCGSVLATIVAAYFRADAGKLKAGLLGFNSVLTSIAIVFYCEVSYDVLDISIAMVYVYVALGAVFTAILTEAVGTFTSTWEVPPLTFPFVLASWLFVGATHFTPALAPGHHEFGPGEAPAAATAPALLEHDEPDINYTGRTWWEGLGKGLGEIFFQDDAVSGYIILLGILINSRISAIMALVGGLISIGVAEWLHVRETDIHLGMYSYSAVLTAIALGGMFFALNIPGIIYMLLGVVLTTWLFPAIGAILQPIHLPAYTMPFIMATWIMMLGKDSFKRLIPIPLAEASRPEEHFRFLKRDK